VGLKLDRFVIIFGTLLLGNPAYAALISWGLQNVTFSDGGTVTGNIVWDSATSTIVSYHITTDGGNTNEFIATVYDSSNPNDVMNLFPDPQPNNAIGITDLSQNAPVGAGYRIIVIKFDNPLIAPLATNNISVTPNSFGVAQSLECFDCNPYRIITGGFASGSVISSPLCSECLPSRGGWRAILGK
jgi:hypothetical protein